MYWSPMAKKSNTNDLFNDPIEDKSQDFARLFETSLARASQTLNVGDSFAAEILSIGSSESFVSTGTTQDAVILNADLMGENNTLAFKVGDTIDVVVTKVRGDEIRVTRKGSKSAPADIENLEDAYDMELPVEGKVVEVVNGGFRVNIHGQTAFCPISHLGAPYGDDPNKQIGRKFEFLITQLDPKKRNIVVSRKKLLELQRAENEGVWMQKYNVGDILEGQVTRTEAYGAFVSLGSSLEGLVHISEVGFTRLKHASEGVRVGENVRVKILKIADEEGRLKISLSIKQAGGATDPWVLVPQSFPVGKIVTGTVEKKEPYGLFVNLGPGVTGLLPKSKWRDSEDAKKYEQAKTGETIQVRIDELKFEERKISLGLPTEDEDNSWQEHVKPQANMGGAFAAAFASAKAKAKKH